MTLIQPFVAAFLVVASAAALWRWNISRQLKPAVPLALGVTLLFLVTLLRSPTPSVWTLLVLALAFPLHAYLSRLADRVRDLETTAVLSKEWSDEWRREQLAGRLDEYREATPELVRAYLADRHRTFAVTGEVAAFFFGGDADDYRRKFRTHADEYRKRFELVQPKEEHTP